MDGLFLDIQFSFLGKNSLCKSQIEEISIIALEECERFYPAFQFLLWDNKSAKDSIKNLMLNTVGEA